MSKMADAVVALVNQNVAHIFGRADVQTARRIGGDDHLGMLEISRARITFCRLPPLSLRDGVSGPGVEMSNSFDQFNGALAHRLAIHEEASADWRPSIRFQGHIFGNGEIGRAAHGAAIFRHIGDARLDHHDRRRHPPLHRTDLDLAAGGFAHATDDLGQFPLSIARHAGHAHDFARAYVQAKDRPARAAPCCPAH